MTTADRLYEEALELSDEDRCRLAHRLMGTVDQSAEAIEFGPEYEAEIERRMNDRTAVSTPWEEVKARLFKYAT